MTASPLSVLLVDADAQAVQSIRDVLASESVMVLHTDSSAVAQTLLQTHDIALVLLAMAAAGVDALSLATAMRGSARSRHTPIVFLLPMGQGIRLPPGALQQGDAAAIDFLYKPLDETVLLSKVRTFCNAQRQQRQLVQRLTDLDRASNLNALMLGALSHDIRTPLATLSLNAELVLRAAEQPAVRQAGERIKSAVAALSRQVEHLVNLSQAPIDTRRPDVLPGDLARLAQDRMALAYAHWKGPAPIQLVIDGRTQARFDRQMLAEALDELLQLAVVHGAGHAGTLRIHGDAPHTVSIQVNLPVVLGTAVRLHLFGGGTVIKGLPAMRMGPGLAAVEQFARAHGASLIGRSIGQEGTFFELMLPRGAP